MKSIYIITIIGGLIGAVAGWLYWKYVGCTSGTCPITSRPLSSTIYGAILGALIFNTAAPQMKKSNPGTEQEIKKNDTNT